ncbi:DUF2512 family protein [Bacillus sp. Marseille-P3661]|uniref:DUF2512 family protein n=1 Tax=Bacillus sp. Marseille-P3661 TaxID=1936234 RepID=UPI0015E1ACF6|nr:DUF2512 family protein [Bacillus sp. Marseille-P3661]
MKSFLMKLILCPIIIGLCSWLLANINYSYFYQPIVIGAVIAAVGTLMEYMLLTRERIWLSTIMDFIAATLIVYFLTNFYETAAITFGGALTIGIVIAIVEHFTHSYLVRSGQTEKGPEFS